MRLFEHPDFAQAILAATEHFRSRGLRPSIIEKDYYVTEVLRVIATSVGDKTIFKGGTSLSKGWNLIDRFSEDIDLYLDPQSFDPPLGAKGQDKALRRLRDSVSTHPGLRFLKEESQTVGGLGRSDRFSYKQHFGGTGEIANRILLESGTASGNEPTQVCRLRSLLSEFMEATGHSLGADDEQPFEMRLLHFRRTFVEKLFAIHGKVELMESQRRELGTYARHYYDLYMLAGTQEVQQMLRTDEYREIRVDYDRISRQSFPRDYRPPDNLAFAESRALFPPAELSASLERIYEQQCRLLCYGPHPSWTQVLARFDQLRELL